MDVILDSAKTFRDIPRRVPLPFIPRDGRIAVVFLLATTTTATTAATATTTAPATTTHLCVFGAASFDLRQPVEKLVTRYTADKGGALVRGEGTVILVEIYLQLPRATLITLVLTH